MNENDTMKPIQGRNRRTSNLAIFLRLIKYAINPRAWDNRLHLAFLDCIDGYMELFNSRKEVLGCGCRISQRKSGDHTWILMLDYSLCRSHTCDDQCKEGSNVNDIS